MGTELKTITAYDNFRAEVEESKNSCNFIPDMSSDDGYDKSKRVALDAQKILTAVEKTRKELKSESLAYGKMVDSEAKLIVEEIQAFQLPHKDAYKELDNLKKEREANRKAELEQRVEVIRTLPDAMADSDSEGVKMALESLQVEECLDFYEFTAEALKARNASREALSTMFADKLKQEKDAAELAELRCKQTIQDQKDRDERIAKEAADAANLQAAASKAAEQEAIEAAALAVKQRKEAEKAAADAAKQAIIDNEIAVENAKQIQIAVQKHKEVTEKVAQERREANKRHVGAIRKAAKESIMDCGCSEKMAKTIVMAINDGLINNVVINY